MEEKRPIIAPTVAEATSMSLTRLGKIFFNYSIVFVVISVMGYMATALLILADAAWTIVALLLVMATIGIILLYYPNIFESSGSGIEAAKELSGMLSRVIPIVAGIGVALCVAAAILLITQKRERCMARFIMSIIFAVLLAMIMLLVLFVGVPTL